MKKTLQNLLILSTLLSSFTSLAETGEEVLSCSKVINSHSVCSHEILDRSANLIKANIRAADEQVFRSVRSLKENKALLESSGIREVTYKHIIKYSLETHTREVKFFKCFHSQGNDRTAEYRSGQSRFNTVGCSYQLLDGEYREFKENLPLKHKILKVDQFVEKDFDFPIIHEDVPQTYKKYLVKRVVLLLPR